jgi:preprotein translocase subunit SecE
MPIASGPATDFRGDPTPPKGSAWSIVLTGWAASSFGFFAMAMNIFKFAQEVRAETSKVTWPSRRETAITTGMVFVMVALASIFFFLADQVIRVVITTVLGFGG